MSPCALLLQSGTTVTTPRGHCLRLQVDKEENAPCHQATATGHGRKGTFRVNADLTRESLSELQQPPVVLLDGEALWRSVRVESYISHVYPCVVWVSVRLPGAQNDVGVALDLKVKRVMFGAVNLII